LKIIQIAILGLLIIGQFQINVYSEKISSNSINTSRDFVELSKGKLISYLFPDSSNLIESVYRDYVIFRFKPNYHCYIWNHYIDIELRILSIGEITLTTVWATVSGIQSFNEYIRINSTHIWHTDDSSQCYEWNKKEGHLIYNAMERKIGFMGKTIYLNDRSNTLKLSFFTSDSRILIKKVTLDNKLPLQPHIYVDGIESFGFAYPQEKGKWTSVKFYFRIYKETESYGTFWDWRIFVSDDIVLGFRAYRPSTTSKTLYLYIERHYHDQYGQFHYDTGKSLTVSMNEPFGQSYYDITFYINITCYENQFEFRIQDSSGNYISLSEEYRESTNFYLPGVMREQIDEFFYDGTKFTFYYEKDEISSVEHEPFWSPLVNFFRHLGMMIIDFLSKIFEPIYVFFENLISIVSSWFGDIFDIIGDFWNDMVSKFTTVIDTLSNFWNDTIGKFNELISKLTDNFVNFFIDTYNWLIDLKDTVIDGFLWFIENARNMIMTMIDNIMNLYQFFVDLYEKFVDFVNYTREIFWEIYDILQEVFPFALSFGGFFFIIWFTFPLINADLDTFMERVMTIESIILQFINLMLRLGNFLANLIHMIRKLIPVI